MGGRIPPGRPKTKGQGMHVGDQEGRNKYTTSECLPILGNTVRITEFISLNINPHMTLDLGKGAKRALVKNNGEFMKWQNHLPLLCSPRPPRKEAINPAAPLAVLKVLLHNPPAMAGRAKSKAPGLQFTSPASLWDSLISITFQLHASHTCSPAISD